MPCHVPATSVSSVHRSPSLFKSAPSIVARLDLAKPAERRAHDLVLRFSTGRWPLWRLLDMRREGLILYVAVEWRRSRASDPYSVVQVSLSRTTLRWRDFQTAVAARRALNRVDGTRHVRTHRSFH